MDGQAIHEEHIAGYWRQGHLVTKCHICWFVDSGTAGRLAEEISKPSVERMAWFSLTVDSKM
jgi:hypothetical protein